MDAEDIAKVLAEHRFPGELLTVFGEAWFVCTCGERVDVPVVDGAVSNAEVNDLWHAHLAAVLAPLVEQAKREGAAEALRRFADSRGVNVGDEDDDYWRGYRQAQRECLHDATACAERAAQTPRDGGGS